MPIITVSQRDVLRSVVLTPAWYRVKINTVGEVPTVTAKGPSTNYPFDSTVLFNGDTGATVNPDPSNPHPIAGVPIDFQFNSKMLGMVIPLIEAITKEKVTPDTRMDLDACKNEEVDVYVDNEPYQGRILNKVKGFRAIKPDVKAVG
jgi:hypothetical protein